MPRKLDAAASLALMLCAAHAHGASIGGVDAVFGGFGTFGLVHSNDSHADFTSDITKPTGAGYTHRWSSDVDSLIGAQVLVSFTSKLSGIVQVISQQNADDTYRPIVQWANIKYQVSDDFSARIGRIVMPSLLFSDTREVAFTRPWVRLPPEAYSLSPLTRSDGLDVVYRLHVADSTNTIQALVGRQDLRLDDGSTVNARDILAISAMTEWGGLTTRLVYQQARVSVSALDPLFNAFRQFGPTGVGLADRYDIDEKRISSVGAGASYDSGDWMATAEWTRVASRSVFGTSTGWYASGGYRLGNFTPYGMYAQARGGNLSDPGVSTVGLPENLAVAATGLNAALNSVLRAKLIRSTVTAGARWDFYKNFDLKAQYDYSRVGTGSTGGLLDIQPGFRASTFSLLSAAIDFVF